MLWDDVENGQDDFPEGGPIPIRASGAGWAGGAPGRL